MNTRKGFTLIELLVVIGILAVLLTIVLVAINPSRQFNQSNNTKRRSDVNAILNAVTQYAADNKGAMPGTIPAALTEISTAGVDICAEIVPTYISALPVDPETGTGDPVTDCAVAGGYTTGYQIAQDATTNRIIVSAPGATLGEVISITR